MSRFPRNHRLRLIDGPAKGEVEADVVRVQMSKKAAAQAIADLACQIANLSVEVVEIRLRGVLWSSD